MVLWVIVVVFAGARVAALSVSKKGFPGNVIFWEIFSSFEGICCLPHRDPNSNSNEDVSVAKPALTWLLAVCRVLFEIVDADMISSSDVAGSVVVIWLVCANVRVDCVRVGSV